MVTNNGAFAFHGVFQDDALCPVVVRILKALTPRLRYNFGIAIDELSFGVAACFLNVC